MDFESIKKIWDQKNGKFLYALNEDAMHKFIHSKVKSTSHITHFSELLILFTNTAAGLFILQTNHSMNIYLYLLAGLMFIIAAFVLVGRLQRKKRENSFDLSMLGELNHSIATAAYQVRLSQIMRWYILPVGFLIMLSISRTGIPSWIILSFLLFFAFTWFGGRWEHNIYVRKKNELELLKNKLTEEPIRE